MGFIFCLFHKLTFLCDVNILEMTCWIYILKKHKEEMLQLPMLSNYRSEDDHGRPYVPRSAREDLTNYYSDVKSA